MKQKDLDELQKMLNELHSVSERLHDIAKVVCDTKNVVDMIVDNTLRVHQEATEIARRALQDKAQLDRLSQDYDISRPHKR